MNLKYLINLQLNPYPNTQLDLFCSDSSYLMHASQVRD